jgi:replicative DNA helicase
MPMDIEPDFEREALFDDRLETALLGGALKGDAMSRWFALNVPASAFFSNFHQTVASELTAMVQDGMQPDVQAVRSRLQAKGMLGDTEIMLLDAIEAESFSSAMVKTHASVVMGFATTRFIRARAQAVVRMCDGSQDVEEILAKAFGIGRNLPRMGTDTVMSGEFDFDKLGAKTPGIPTPWKTVNQACKGSGWYFGEFAVVMGDRGSGKTGVLIDAAITAHRAGFKPALATLEMTAEQLIGRQVKSLCGWDEPPRSTVEFPLFADAVDEVRRMNIPIYDSRQGNRVDRSIESLVAWAYDARSMLGIDMLCIDYAQKLTTRQKSENSTRSQDHCANLLDDLVKQTGLAAIIGSQRSLDPNQKGVWRSKDSIKWEDNAALVLQLRRARNETEGKIVVSKNRHDREPSFGVTFLGPQVKYVEESSDPYAEP